MWDRAKRIASDARRPALRPGAKSTHYHTYWVDHLGPRDEELYKYGVPPAMPDRTVRREGRWGTAARAAAIRRTGRQE